MYNKINLMEVDEMKKRVDIDKARKLLDVLEMKNSGSKVENLIKLLCVKEMSSRNWLI